ncbi:hypothetical protein F4814DRAFT_407801 [Daldinia grandis]|nr:hypothetical protein F4814DRAFT_407801 [Daldinia grandis]
MSTRLLQLACIYSIFRKSYARYIPTPSSVWSPIIVCRDELSFGLEYLRYLWFWYLLFDITDMILQRLSWLLVFVPSRDKLTGGFIRAHGQVCLSKYIPKVCI